MCSICKEDNTCEKRNVIIEIRRWQKNNNNKKQNKNMLQFTTF